MTKSLSKVCAMVGVVLLVVGFAGLPRIAGAADAPVSPGPTPKAKCGPGSKPETGLQGRVSAADHASGRVKQGFNCNTQLVGQFGQTGGYKVERYVDAAGHECAFYDSTLLFPKDAVTAGQDRTGGFVLDMSNPAKPKQTAVLATPAMQSPHESLVLSTKRGILAAVTANPVFAPGFVDVYDVTKDCRAPELKASLPVGTLGHESGMAPDGMTFYAASTGGGIVTAVDLTNPSLPVPIATMSYQSHGLSVSDDGTRIYIAATGGAGPDRNKAGLIILDVSEIQARKASPKEKMVSTLTWDTVTIPQNAIPITIKGHKYVMEIDEFSVNPGSSVAANGSIVGGGRIIDVADETKPKVVSNLMLEVNMPKNRAAIAGDPEAANLLQGYAGHYCNVPKRNDPGIVACSFILSGLRVFDIRDPRNPKEIAYFNPPPKANRPGQAPSNYAMSSPAFAPERGEIWYTDGNSGFYNVKVTNGVWPFPAASSAKKPAAAKKQTRTEPAPAGLPATGTSVPFAAVGIALLGLAIGLRRRTARE